MITSQKLNTKEAATYLNVKPNTLEIWRCRHKGPRYAKIGTRVVYDLEDLEAFFESCVVDTLESQDITFGGKK